ncbi:MAG TPA: cytochrome c3 family protein [Thermodesulfobacteriota bacterium]|nr:cytochrome c3 family protein [Thermodesulfobacteriota bacterium]
MTTKECRFLMILVAVLMVWIGSTVQAQPDKITLDHSKEFGKKERSAVPFPHNLHGEAGISCKDCHHVYENGKNVLDESNLEEGHLEVHCSTCHPSKSRIDLQQAFHNQCMGCHKQFLKEKKKTGPRFCGECHLRK